MKLTTKLGIAAMTYLLTACASGPRKVSMTEATVYAKQITTTAPPQQPQRIYTQPANKTTPCKLPTSNYLLELKNYRHYWDGDCKNGYAYGLGRGIALSDTHHSEEITIYNGDGDSGGKPTRSIDYVGNSGSYSVIGANYPARAGYAELITNNDAEFSVQYRVWALDEKGNYQYSESSPFSPVKTTVNLSRGKPAYVMWDFSAFPGTSDQVQMVFFAADSATTKPLGFRIVRLRNGVVQHQKLAADGQSIAELVQLPPEYITELAEGIGEVQGAIQKANAAAAKAQQMEGEYLHMACAADYSIKGVPAKDMEIARQICSWRDQWKEPYARAEAKYKQEIERKRQAVAQTEQERAYTASQMAQTAAFAASMAQLNLALQQQNNNNTLQQINQMNQQLQNQNNEMMKSWAPQQNKTTFCQTVGSQIFCR